MSAVTLDAIAAAAGAEALAVLGGFHPGPGDGAPEGCATLLMLGPAPGAAFWGRFRASDEYRDGAPDPLDRWSRRVLAALATAFGGVSLLPSDGPPYPPFIAWAIRTGRAWASPVGLLVHDRAGLMMSFRGALALPVRLTLPPPPQDRPCETCAEKPCLTTCPVGALGTGGYDVAACRAFLATPAGSDCMGRGCAVRRACPVSAGQARPEAQSAFHMRAFNP